MTPTLDLQQTDCWKVRTETVEVSEVRGQHSIAPPCRRRHHDRIDDSRSLHGGDCLSRNASQIRKKWLDDASLKERRDPR